LVSLACAVPACFIYPEKVRAEVMEVPSSNDKITAIRRPYMDTKWRVVVSGSDTTSELRVSRKVGDRTGCGLHYENESDIVDGGYEHDFLGMQVYRELVTPIFPLSAGLSFSAGAVLRRYILGTDRDFGKLGGYGVGAAGTVNLQLMLPVFSMLAGTPLTAWVPHLYIQVGFLWGWGGNLKTRRDIDWNGDGSIDLHKGDRFHDPDYRNAGISWNLPQLGFLWCL
jgi:hypothetical protein